jgi:hypothetical protein
LAKKPSRFLIVLLCAMIVSLSFAWVSYYITEGGTKPPEMPVLPRITLVPQETYADMTLDVVGDGEIVMIGDSLMVGSTDALLEIFPQASIDGKVGRSMQGGIVIAQRAVMQKPRPKVVVVELATNIQHSTMSALEDMVFLLQDIPKVVFVTGYARTKSTDAVAELIRGLVGRSGNIRIADWAAVADEHPEYLAGDGIHLRNNTANAAFAQCLAEAIRS